MFAEAHITGAVVSQDPVCILVESGKVLPVLGMEAATGARVAVTCDLERVGDLVELRARVVMGDGKTTKAELTAER